jgi:hypothetical protein
MAIAARDREILRRLAHRKALAAQSPVNGERRAAWFRHDLGTGGRPMVLAEVQGVCDANSPAGDAALECQDPWARGIERRMRREIYEFETLRDDHVVTADLDVNWQVQASDYGVPIPMRWASNEGRLAGRHWDPPIRDLDADFPKLRPRTFTVDRSATMDEKARVEDVVGDILRVRIRGSFYWTLGLTWRAIELVGLENLMLFMFDNPAGLHRLMAFLRDDHLAFARWLEREGLYTLNNENDYIGSGSYGYTHDLPRPDRREGDPVRTRDLWVLLESQETVGVGPGQFEEFVFPYQAAIAERFGKIYYGCCEPLHSRWSVVRRIRGLARVSVSPWADQARMAEACGARYVFSRKSNPALISTGAFDEDAIRADVRTTLDTARDCRVEIIMKDVHTLDGHPERLARWVRIVREEIDRSGGM